MENAIIKETADVLKRLSPQNQEYFMTLVRLAEVAENGVKNRETIRQSCPSSAKNLQVRCFATKHTNNS